MIKTTLVGGVERLGQPMPRVPAAKSPLTKKQRITLVWKAHGYTHGQIAARYNTTMKNVEASMAKVRMRLGMTTAQAIDAYLKGEI